MLIFEVEQPNAGPDAEKLAALTQFLIGRATNTGATKTISTPAYLQLAQNMGISLSQSQFGTERLRFFFVPFKHKKTA